jgi:hypothetical protein
VWRRPPPPRPTRAFAGREYFAKPGQHNCKGRCNEEDAASETRTARADDLQAPSDVRVPALLVLASPATAEDFGGAPAQPLPQDAVGGGIVAPGTPGALDDAPDAVAAAAEAPDADAAQDDTPTTPGGEEQPPGGEDGGGQTPGEEGGDPTTSPGAGGVGGESTGGLPRTGLELLALTMIGLGLLLAGGALWPTSSWPPPRGRVSRSTQHR